MPKDISRNILCPDCKKEFPINIKPSVVPATDTAARLRILNENFFNVTCPLCEYNFQLAYPCIYTDYENHFMVCLEPRGAQSINVPEELVKSLPFVVKRVVSTPRELKEKILIFENGLNDIAVEIVKYTFTDILKKKFLDDEIKLYFRGITEDIISFAVYRSSVKSLSYHGTRSTVYAQACEIIKSTYSYNEDSFIKTNDAMIKKILLDYKSNK